MDHWWCCHVSHHSAVCYHPSVYQLCVTHPSDLGYTRLHWATLTWHCPIFIRAAWSAEFRAKLFTIFNNNFTSIWLHVCTLLQDDPEWLWVVRSDGHEGFVPAGFIYPLDAIQKQRKFSEFYYIALCTYATVQGVPKCSNVLTDYNNMGALLHCLGHPLCTYTWYLHMWGTQIKFNIHVLQNIWTLTWVAVRCQWPVLGPLLHLLHHLCHQVGGQVHHLCHLALELSTVFSNITNTQVVNWFRKLKSK